MADEVSVLTARAIQAVSICVILIVLHYLCDIRLQISFISLFLDENVFLHLCIVLFRLIYC